MMRGGSGAGRLEKRCRNGSDCNHLSLVVVAEEAVEYFREKMMRRSSDAIGEEGVVGGGRC